MTSSDNGWLNAPAGYTGPEDDACGPDRFVDLNDPVMKDVLAQQEFYEIMEPGEHA